LNPLQKMRVLEEMAASLNDPHVVDLDGSAWDAHVGVDALKVEWKFYDKAWKHAGYARVTRAKMRRMGKAQLNNSGRFRVEDGMGKYKVKGNRMSGDLNTGNGNSVLMSLYIATIMLTLGITEENWRMLVDGDDSVVMLSGDVVRAHPNLNQEIKTEFLRYSQEVKVGSVKRINVLDNMEPVDFCQCRPVKVGGLWRLVRNPRKVYSGYKMQCVYYRSVEEMQRFWSTVSAPEMIYSVGVPVHCEYFNTLHRMSGTASPLMAVTRRFWLRACNTVKDLMGVNETDEVEWSTRESYAKAFDYPILYQLQDEEELRGHQSGDLPQRWEQFAHEAAAAA